MADSSSVTTGYTRNRRERSLQNITMNVPQNQAFWDCSHVWRTRLEPKNVQGGDTASTGSLEVRAPRVQPACEALDGVAAFSAGATFPLGFHVYLGDPKAWGYTEMMGGYLVLIPTVLFCTFPDLLLMCGLHQWNRVEDRAKPTRLQTSDPRQRHQNIHWRKDRIFNKWCWGTCYPYVQEWN